MSAAKSALLIFTPDVQANWDQIFATCPKKTDGYFLFDTNKDDLSKIVKNALEIFQRRHCDPIILLLALEGKPKTKWEYIKVKNEPIYEGHDTYQLVSKSSSLKAASLAKKVLELKIKMVAFDFDLTIIQGHTGGVVSREKLQEWRDLVSPDFIDFYHALREIGIKVGVVTHGDNQYMQQRKFKRKLVDPISGELLVRSVLVNALGESETKEIPIIEGNPEFYKSMPSDKSYHLAQLRLQDKPLLKKAEVLLIDDSRKNVAYAIHHGYHAWLVEGDGFKMSQLVEPVVFKDDDSYKTYLQEVPRRASFSRSGEQSCDRVDELTGEYVKLDYKSLEDLFQNVALTQAPLD